MEFYLRRLFLFVVAFLLLSLFSFVFIPGQNFISSSKDSRYDSRCLTDYKNNKSVVVIDIGNCILLLLIIYYYITVITAFQII